MAGSITSHQCTLRTVVSRTLAAIFGNTVYSIRTIGGTAGSLLTVDSTFYTLQTTNCSVFSVKPFHPVVRVDEEEIGNLIYHYNQRLEVDGWQIVEGGKISGQRYFVPLKMGRRARILDEPVGWEKVQDLISEARELLQAGLYPRVGSACRDALIYVAKELRAIAPEITSGLQEGNVQGILDAFLNTKRPGRSNERLRAYARTPWNFAQHVQHDTEADYISAALCLEAVASTAAIVYLLATYDQGGDLSGEIDDLLF